MLNELFTKNQEIIARYEMSTTEDERNKIEKEMRDFRKGIQDKGTAFAQLFILYNDSKEKENSLLDLGQNCIWEREIPELLAAIEEAGITEFTFSSTWSSSNKVAWEFTKAGWNIKGMTLVNTHKEWPGKGYHQEPAYIFSKN